MDVGRHRTLETLQPGDHGSTFGALAISGNDQRRSIFEPLLPYGTFVSPCYAYRDRRPTETDGHYVRRLAAELDELIVELGPETVAAFVAETVVGSTSGAVPPVDGYFRAMREVCDRHGVLLLLDEIMAGLGRTGVVLAGYYVAKGMTASNAIAKVRKIRPGSVETDEQAEAIADFARRRRAR